MSDETASISINVAPGEDTDAAPEGAACASFLAHISVSPPAVAERLDGDVCLVIDVSGSMQLEAVVKTEVQEGAPTLSVLDIVKHAVKTVVHTMGPGDRLGIVSYSDEAKVVLPLTAMDEDGQLAADGALGTLRANGQTNLWDGLQTGLNMLQGNAREGASMAVMVLTDGVPNIVPAGGHLQALASYREAQGDLPATIHTFGFGKELDSKLLSDIAVAGDGMYVFIPDAGFVGTALVNCTANALVAVGRSAFLELAPAEDCQIDGIYGYDNHGGRVPLGTLQLGQTKDVVVSVTAPEGYDGPVLSATLTYLGSAGAASAQDSGSATIERASEEFQALMSHVCRLRLTGVIDHARRVATEPDGKLEDARELVQGFLDEVAAISHPGADALRQDLEGQVMEAFSREDWFSDWGGHYVLSLARAHLTQQCNNFKDPGVQLYGGELFEEVRDRADEMFLALPPPAPEDNSSVDLLVAMGFDEETATKALAAANNDAELAATFCMEGIPEHPASHARHGGARPAYSRPVYSMAAYHNSAGPCFTGESLIEMADGSATPLRKLRKGDSVMVQRCAAGLGKASVLCVVETLTSGEANLVELSPGLQATPWHPVQDEGRWVSACDVAEKRMRPCESVFNLVLDDGHVPRIGGVWTVSLAHGLMEHGVQHEYWGTDRVLDDLRGMPGWHAGWVQLNPGCVIRDRHGHVCGLRQ